MRVELAGSHGRSRCQRRPGRARSMDAEKARLVRLADMVTWARSGVERDYRGDVVNAHALGDADAICQTIGSDHARERCLSACLLRLPCGLRPAARGIVSNRCGAIFCSTWPPIPRSSPDDVRMRVVRPLTTVKQNLVALHALRLLTCKMWRE